MNMFSFVSVPRDIPTIGPETIVSIGRFPITNSFLMSVLIVVLLFVLARAIFRRRDMVPMRFQNTAEALYEGMYGLVEQVSGGSSKTAWRIFPIVGALFVYIGISNLIGLIPGITEIQYEGTPLFRPPTTDFNVTVGLALSMVILIQIESVRRAGIFGHLGQYFQFRQVWQGFRRGLGEGFTAIIGFMIGLLDIISEFAKVISLSLRLFGNMYAGVVLATVILGAIAVLLPSVWLGLSLLFALVQAIVFGSLVAAYYAIALQSEGGEET